MDFREIRREIEELVRLLEGTDVESLDISIGDVRVRLRRTGLRPSRGAGAETLAGGEADEGQRAPREASPVTAETPQDESARNEYLTITSPMVGTFYRAPAPDARPFVEVGDVVEPGQTVCIIEAMKLMNELVSEVRGRVVEILVENGQPVEYGQELFLLEPQD